MTLAPASDLQGWIRGCLSRPKEPRLACWTYPEKHNKENIMSKSVLELIVWAVVLTMVVLVAVTLSVIKNRNEVANTWKFRTTFFVFLAAGVLMVPQLWVIATPLYLVLAWRSFRAGSKAGKSGRIAAAGTPVVNGAAVLTSVLTGIGSFLLLYVKSAIVDAASQSDEEEKYYFDGSGRPYLTPQPDQYLNASEGN
jgi:uncharacterized membrane protein